MSSGLNRALLFLVLTLLLPAIRANAGLQEDVRRLAQGSSLGKSEVGVHVVEVTPGARDGTVLADYQGDQQMLPASNLKLVTTAATLHYLGDDFRFRTLLVERTVDGRREVGVIGDGDPTLGDSELLKQFGWTTTTTLDQWAEILKPGGRIDSLLMDDSVFDDDFMHPRWGKHDQIRPYGAQIGGLNLNENCLDFYVLPHGPGERVGYRLSPPTSYPAITNRCVRTRTNAVILDRVLGTNRITLSGQTNATRTQGPLRITIDNPTAFFGVAMRDRLLAAGIDVPEPAMQDRTLRGAVISGNSDWKHIGGLETKLSVVLARLNKNSENLYAEALLKRVGHQVTGEPGSWENGTAAIGDYLETLGFKPDDDFVLSDGSGLSRGNRVTATLITACLADSFRHHREMLVPSLAVAGREGTVRTRFRRYPELVGHVFAKSGYISGVYTLSGLVEVEGRWFAFSTLVNDANSGSAAKTFHENVVAAIVDAVR